MTFPFPFVPARTKPFPDVISTNSGGDTAINASKSITLPSGIVAGDLILLCLAGYADGGPIVNTPSGFTPLGVNDGTRTYVRYAFKRAVGTESGTSVTVASGAGNFFLGWTAHNIRGAADPVISGNASGTSGAPDCPSFSPSGGAGQILWVACADAYGLTQTQSAPSGYSGYVVGAANASGVDYARMNTAWRKVNTATENPPAYPNAILTSGVTSPQWLADTIAIYPA